MGKGGQQKKIKRKTAIEPTYEHQYLEQTFRTERFSVNFCSAFVDGYHSLLTVIRRCTPEAQISKTDKLGINAKQYTTKSQKSSDYALCESYLVLLSRS